MTVAVQALNDWECMILLIFVVSEFMFSLKAAIFFSVHVIILIDSGASSNAELVFTAFSWFALAIFLYSLDFVACAHSSFTCSFVVCPVVEPCKSTQLRF